MEQLPGIGSLRTLNLFQGAIGCTPNSVPVIFIVFPRDSWDYNL